MLSASLNYVVASLRTLFHKATPHQWQIEIIGDIEYRTCPTCKAVEWRQFGHGSWGKLHLPLKGKH